MTRQSGTVSRIPDDLRLKYQQYEPPIDINKIVTMSGITVVSICTPDDNLLGSVSKGLGDSHAVMRLSSRLSYCQARWIAAKLLGRFVFLQHKPELYAAETRTDPTPPQALKFAQKLMVPLPTLERYGGACKFDVDKLSLYFGVETDVIGVRLKQLYGVI